VPCEFANARPRRPALHAKRRAARAGVSGPDNLVSGDVYTIKAAAGTTNGSLGVAEATVPPGGGPVAHVHTKTDEAFYILSGELEILDGARKFTARTGDFIFVPRGIRHRFRNVDEEVTRMLFMLVPGSEEGVFAYGDEPQPGRLPTPWPPDRFATPEILKFSADHAVDILPEAD
jgi:mannose-6-phosphate isomerase-like protein (cupin superfamily)